MKKLKLRKCYLLGSPVTVTEISTVVDNFIHFMGEFAGKYICVCNVHTTVMTHDDAEYREIQDAAIMNLPDGKPLSVVIRQNGYRHVGRVTGPDLMREVFKISVSQQWRHFFYGSDSATLNQLRDRLSSEYPNIQIVGMYAPPFDELSSDEEKDVIRLINQANPDFIWVGLGAPKQERFMYAHKDLFRGVMLGVGAGFNFHAGTVKRAPSWVQKIGLEWFYRMMQEPRRLWKRYFSTNFRFIYLLLKSRCKVYIQRM